MAFQVQLRQSKKCGSVRNDEIINLHLGSGAGLWVSIPCLLQGISHIYWFHLHKTINQEKRKVEDTVLSCESYIKFIKSVEANRLVLGYTTTSKFPKNKSSKNYRKYISDHHRTIDDTYVMSKAVQLQVQGQWTRWLNYIQQDFSWATLLAMPANLTSFCLASTFDTLPSPTNLKRWRITTEAMCTLCSKDVYTTAHILGACKVLLEQGRYTFRHDTVLHKIIQKFESFKSFILNIKQTVPISPKSSIKFVKKGT